MVAERVFNATIASEKPTVLAFLQITLTSGTVCCKVVACRIASGMVVQIVDRAMLGLIESAVFTFIGHFIPPFFHSIAEKPFPKCGRFCVRITSMRNGCFTDSELIKEEVDDMEECLDHFEVADISFEFLRITI